MLSKAESSARGVGIGVIGVGLALTHDLCVAPVHRFGGYPFGFTLVGPLALVLGVLLVFAPRRAARRGDPVANRRGAARLLWAGVTLMAIPAVLVAVTLVRPDDEGAGLLLTLSAVFLGLPGVALLGIAGWLRIR